MAINEQVHGNGNAPMAGVDVPPAAPTAEQVRQTQTQQSYQSHEQAPTQTKRSVDTIFNIAEQSAFLNSLSKEGEKYIAELKQSLKVLLENARVNAKIDVVPLNSPQGVYVAIFDHKIYAIVMEENTVLNGGDTFRNANNSVTAHLVKAIQDSIMKQYPGHTFYGYMIVDRSSYDRAGILASYLFSILIRWNEFNERSTIESMTKDVMGNEGTLIFDFSYDTGLNSKQNEYYRYAERLDPHGVHARADVGINVYIRVKDRVNPGAFNVQNKVKHLCSIGLYTTFVYMTAPDGTVKAIPIVHISEILSPIISPNMIWLALAVAHNEVYGPNHVWMKQFQLGMKPNLGNLFNDAQTGEPVELKSIEELSNFCNKQLSGPLLVLDVVEGRSRIPGIEFFSVEDNSQTETVRGFINRFAGNRNPYTGPLQCKLIEQTFAGRTHLGNDEYKDTRYLDYLHVRGLVDRADPNTINLTRFCHEAPSQYAWLATYFDFEKSYVNNVCILQKELLNYLSSLIFGNINYEATQNGNEGYVDGTFLMPLVEAMNTNQNQYANQMYVNNPFAEFVSKF